MNLLKQKLPSVLNAVREPLIILDSDLTVVAANRSFYEMFDVRKDETENAPIFSLGNRQWNIPALRELLKQVVSCDKEIDDFEVDHPFERIGRKIMHLNARRIFTETMRTQWILLAIQDVTDREVHARRLEEIVAQRTAEIQALKDQLEAERAYLQDEIKLTFNYENIIGCSPAIKYVFYKIEQIARTDTHVLILGETGTGKELVARAIHHLSLRKHRALVKVNCAVLPSNLIENELFGHEKGAFTGAHSQQPGRFEIADGATLFLDEIGELPLELQPKLLQVIESGRFERLGSTGTKKVDARLIAATNRNLEDEVRKGRFRKDLWYRLNVFPITIPPLRDRREDIPMLVKHFIAIITKRMGKKIETIPVHVMDALMHYSWPGNVRELENVLERAVINSSGPKLRLADDLKTQVHDGLWTGRTLEEVEKEYIIRVLNRVGWKVSGRDSAAEILGMNRSTLRARMRKLSIRKESAE
ncbi:sigma 54-interacting transcriptional regulator [bacterium]|nr:sigma 54-interacting transcriptional regulator [candidate division CSSED10-310 bacterium]